MTLWAVFMAILLLESYDNVSTVDPGFEAAGVLTVELPLTRRASGEPANLAGVTADLLPRLRGLPGVTTVSATTSLPLESTALLTYAIGGAAGEDEALTQFRGVSPDFFGTLGIRIVRGRAFAESDGPNAAPVAIVSELAARRHWPGRDPIGERIAVFPSSSYGEAFTRTVVGVVEDVHELGLAESEALESLYVPIIQISLPLAKPILGGVILLVRSEVGASGLVEAVRREIRDYDRAQPLGEIRTMDDVVRRSAAPYRFRTTAVAGFAMLALLLAAVGVHGVVSVLAQARRRELAIRRALGSTAAALVRLVARQGMLPVAWGILLGGAGAVPSVRLVQSFLFGVSGANLAALGVTVVVLVATAGLAMVPAVSRSVSADPMSELRLE